MPTADAYRAGATELRGWIDTLPAVESAIDVCRDDPGVRGSSVAEAIPSALSFAAERLAEAHTAARELADELDRRARLCDAYTEAMRAWEVAHARWREAEFLAVIDTLPGGVAQPEPRPPAPPFAGAEAG